LHLVSATIFHALLVIQLWETDRGQLGACQNRPTTPAGDANNLIDMCGNVKKMERREPVASVEFLGPFILSIQYLSIQLMGSQN
jgi:hypothetical protein